MSPINDDKIFVFKISSFYKSKTDADAYEPASTFTSYANAERHLLQYLEGFQNTLDLGGEIAPGNTFSYFLYRLSPGEVLIGLPPPQTLPHPFGFF
ncbi:hypothetical protein [Pedobacter sp. P26]|uniref:hypothetical protein n=1 Tax=Pedobacter sp. P26 TaxID=3423956 RepID=UPI003D664FD8